MLGPFRRCRDEGQVDFALGGAGEFDLGLFRRLGEALQGLFVLAQIDAFVALEGGGQVIDDHLVEVIAAQMGVATGGEHLKHAVANLQHRDVKRTAAQIEHQDALVALAIQAIGQGCGRGLVDDAQHFEAGDLARVLGGLALGIVEVGRHRDHRLGDGFTEILTGIFGELAQHFGRDFLRGELLVEHRRLDLDVGASLLNRVTHLFRFFRHLIDATADEALHRIKGVLRIHDRLALGDLSHQFVLVLGVGHHRRSRAEPFGIGNHRGLAALHHGDAAIRGAEVNTDNLTHGFLSPGVNEI